MNRFLLLAAVVVLFFPFPDDNGQECHTGVWKRHDAFNQVFSRYPSRIDFDVDGYIATVDCNDMGKTGSIILNGMVYSVKVADCLNRNTKPQHNYQGDIDYRIWYDSGIYNAPTQATLCWSQE